MKGLKLTLAAALCAATAASASAQELVEYSLQVSGTYKSIIVSNGPTVNYYRDADAKRGSPLAASSAPRR